MKSLMQLNFQTNVVQFCLYVTVFEALQRQTGAQGWGVLPKILDRGVPRRFLTLTLFKD